MTAQAVGKIEFNRMGPDQSDVDACFHRPQPFVMPKRRPLVVGVGHEAQQGKDTLVNHLVETFGKREQGTWGKTFPMDVLRYAFADPLKIEVFDFLQALSFANYHDFISIGGRDFSIITIPYSKVFSREEKLVFINENKVVLRPLLQKFGTEYRRSQNHDYWVRETQIKIDYDLPQVALLSDMRFLNETEICDFTVRVVRKGFTSVAAGHVSEQELKDFPYDYVIEAESVEELKGKGELVFNHILTRKGLLPGE